MIRRSHLRPKGWPGVAGQRAVKTQRSTTSIAAWRLAGPMPENPALSEASTSARLAEAPPRSCGRMVRSSKHLPGTSHVESQRPDVALERSLSTGDVCSARDEGPRARLARWGSARRRSTRALNVVISIAQPAGYPWT